MNCKWVHIDECKRKMSEITIFTILIKSQVKIIEIIPFLILNGQ